MPNINRDYLIILDVKKGNVSSPNIYFFNTDKNTSNIYVQLIIKETDIIATPIENVENFKIKANILKPNMVGKIVEGNLVNEAKAIYEFKLPADCTDFSGNAKIEFEVYCTVDGVEEIATSFATKFKVYGSVLTEQNKYIEDSSDYPILKELMAEVKVINETAHELDTVIRTLQADMIEANNEMNTNEATRQVNETARVTNEATRKEAERNRSNQEVAREEAEATREGQETTRAADENERKTAENQRKANEEVRASNEVERKANEASRITAENTRVANEEERQTNETNRETAEQIRRTNEQARITAETARVTEHEQMRTELNEVKAENAILMENDKKVSDRMTQVEISDKRQYVIMEGLMNSAGDGYLKIEDTGNDTTLYNSVEGFVDVKNITGNTMVNSIKNPDDEFTLNGDINETGTSVKLTEAVDNGQVDVLAEGNTMVNVCDQQEPVAITTDTNTFPLRYLYTSTEYTLQFESDTAVTIDITLGGYTLSSQNIVIGLNKINIITPNELTDNNLILNGTGFNASNIVVTEATDKDFGYFSGMKSVGELEENKIEIVSANGTDSTAEGYLSNSKQILLNEPLRAVGDTKDRFVQIDGKWYVERNVNQATISKNDDFYWFTTNVPETSIGVIVRENKCMTNKPSYLQYNGDIISDISGNHVVGWNNDETVFVNSYTQIGIILPKSKIGDKENMKNYLIGKSIVYILKEPTYEPVEIAPTVNTYTDITHITNNSTIPMNMPIVNSGYEIIAKPSTKYTVVGITNGRIGDSTIVNGTITTPATITDNFLRPYGTGKTSKVMLLEGEPANIPGYFKGIKSVFEDKVTEDGKYAVEVKVVGKNKFDKNKYFPDTTLKANADSIPYGGELKSSVSNASNYISIIPNTEYILSWNYDSLLSQGFRPLVFYDKNKQGINIGDSFFNITNKNATFVSPNNARYVRFVYDKNCYNIQLEEGTVATEYEPYHETKQTLYLDEPLYNANNITIYNDKLGYWKNWDKVVFDGSEDENWKLNKEYDYTVSYKNISLKDKKGSTPILCDKLPKSNNNTYEGWNTNSSDNYTTYFLINKSKLTSVSIDSFILYLQSNPVTVVYELAEPVFIPLIDNCPNWVIGSWDNCSIHFDSIIPLKDTRYRYTGNVPSVMAMSNDVAEAKSISDEQDAMIVDLATQVAVLEMMTL